MVQKETDSTAKPRAAITDTSPLSMIQGFPEAAEASASADSVVASHAASDVASTNGQEPTPLQFLNDATRTFASWDVSVDRAHIEEYSYKWEGQTRQGKIFKCTLVSVIDDTQYCSAEIRKFKGSRPDIFDKASNTYQDGFRFKMSKVALNGRSSLNGSALHAISWWVYPIRP